MAARLTNQTKLERAWAEQRAAHAAMFKAAARLQKAMAAIPPLQAAIRKEGRLPKNGPPLSPYGYDEKGNNVAITFHNSTPQAASA